MNQPLVFICNSQYFTIPTSIGIYYLRKPKFQFKHISRFKIQSKKNPQVKEQHCLAEMFSRVSIPGGIFTQVFELCFKINFFKLNIECCRFLDC